MDGIIIINKEKKYTSNDVVKKVKKILNCNKVGHTGTLDPNATGVLPLLLGNATKISKYIINHNKEYEALLQLGEKTTTADGEGIVLKKSEPNPKIWNLEQIEKVLKSFIGEHEQIPPMYSAIKVNGKKLYQYARNGEKIDVEPRKIEIFDIELKKINEKEKQIEFYVKCSKGTYIRTLCEEIAESLNTVGYMKELNRISVGEFSISNAITIEELENQLKSNTLDKIITIESFFSKYQSIIIKKEEEMKRYVNGLKIQRNNVKDGICKVYYKEKFTGIGTVKQGNIKRDIVL